MVTLKVVRLGCPARLRIAGPRDAFRVLQPLARGLDREHFWRLDLDSRRRLLGCELVAVGTLDMVLVHPRLCAAAHKRGYVVLALMLRSPNPRKVSKDDFLRDAT